MSGLHYADSFIMMGILSMIVLILFFVILSIRCKKAFGAFPPLGIGKKGEFFDKVISPKLRDLEAQCNWTYSTAWESLVADKNYNEAYTVAKLLGYGNLMKSKE